MTHDVQISGGIETCGVFPVGSPVLSLRAHEYHRQHTVQRVFHRSITPTRDGLSGKIIETRCTLFCFVYQPYLLRTIVAMHMFQHEKNTGRCVRVCESGENKGGEGQDKEVRHKRCGRKFFREL